jgi:DNA-binding LacI/PurR family transcriptional regulator
LSIIAVARESGVSVATVSRVFNFPERVRPDTRSRVHAVAQKLGYQPNASAQTLRTKSSRVIGVVLPTLLNPVFAECLQGLAQAAREGGYAILPMTTEYDIAQEERAVNQLLGANVDGMVLVVSHPRESKALERLRTRGVRFVLAYNRDPVHPCVSVDSEEAVASVVVQLVDLGHGRIAMVSGQLSASDRAQQRLRGYTAGMQAAGLEPRLLEVPFIDDAAGAVQKLVTGRFAPTALVCSNDLLAIRAMRAVHRAGLRVPQDVSVVGFDGIALGRDLTLELGTVAQPNATIGHSAAHLLIDAIRDNLPVKPSASVTLPWAFRMGESIGRAPDSQPVRQPRRASAARR